MPAPFPGVHLIILKMVRIRLNNPTILQEQKSRPFQLDILRNECLGLFEDGAELAAWSPLDRSVRC